jgi:hypothetical protein
MRLRATSAPVSSIFIRDWNVAICDWGRGEERQNTITTVVSEYFAPMLVSSETVMQPKSGLDITSTEMVPQKQQIAN